MDDYRQYIGWVKSRTARPTPMELADAAVSEQALQEELKVNDMRESGSRTTAAVAIRLET